MTRSCWHRQQGVALLMVMVLVALATIIAATLLSERQVDVQRTANVINQNQSLLYAQAAEKLLGDLLAEDLRRDNRDNHKVDHLGEIWAKPLPAYPVDGGSVQASIEDLHDRFNINSVLRDGRPEPVALAVFRRLLARHEGDAAVADALIDWLDANQEVEGGTAGAEDDYYLRLPQPYRTADGAMLHVSELRQLRGMTPELYKQLLPLVCTLPASSTINLNTAKKDVLRALVDNAPDNLLDDFIRARSKGFASVQDAAAHPLFSALPAADLELLKKMLGVESRYFALTAEAMINDRRSVLLSILERKDSKTLNVLLRDTSGKGWGAAGNNTRAGTGNARDMLEQLLK